MTLTRSGSEIAAYFAEIMGEALRIEDASRTFDARYNIAPTQSVPTVLRETDAALGVAWKKWGLVPSWSKTPDAAGRLFNARSETVAEKPSFRSAFRKRRCLVPADGFYEWTPRNRGHEPFHFTPKQAPLFAFAGLFESWLGETGEVVDSCTILTTEANEDLADIHTRMPLILTPEDCRRWLDPALSTEALAPVLAPPRPGQIERRRVGRVVNDVREDGPHCLAPPRLAPQIGLFESERPD